MCFTGEAPLTVNHHAGLVVLLADAAHNHVAIEVASVHATEHELAALTRTVSDRIGFEMSVYATLPTRDHPRAVAKARALLRFNKELPNVA
jgi:hypothetical protein